MGLYYIPGSGLLVILYRKNVCIELILIRTVLREVKGLLVSRLDQWMLVALFVLKHPLPG